MDADTSGNSAGFCTSCGTQLPRSVNFCPHCGARTHDLIRASQPELATAGPMGPEGADPDQPAGDLPTATAPQATGSSTPSALPAAVAEPSPHAASEIALAEKADMVTAGVGQRLAANLIDGVIVFAVFLAISLFLVVVNMVAPGLRGLYALVYIGELVALVWYHVYYTSLGGTIGKRVLGVKVVDVNTGEPIGSSRAATRYGILVLSALPCYLGYLSPFFDRTGRLRGWHDMAADDRVIQAPAIAIADAVRP